MKRPSRGYVLPFVLIALAAAGLLVFSLASEGWHHARAVALAGRGDAAANAIEEAEAMALAQWDDDSLWQRPLHHEVQRSVTTQLGQSVTVTWSRPHPFVAWLHTRHEMAGNARWSGIRRELIRAVWLHTPAVPVRAVLAVPGQVSGGEGTLLSGTDTPTPTSACGMTRDTASTPAVAALAVVGDPPGHWPGAPLPDTTARRVADSAAILLPALGARAEHVTWGPSPAPLPERNGWQALWLSGHPVIVDGPTQWRGLLVIDGDLELRGNVTIEGLLIVRGNIDARAAQWQLQGAAMSADPVTGHAHLGTQTRIFFDRCAVQMALATVARPRVTPFSLWQPLAP
ncbi:hypothetical protein [Gemmatimonas phototrophica]|uniref:Uncharacterized protein n=1 Tax=Gemmatimonas phototrophica TaxID=1379270 RepID=A0A143BLG1_9BACT|nr:hypothetical protein [Gemmatimonas phototrophica]AMW05443.1 hypothetical protein GEMMAAP_12785 [Gemmatimonas phototrophica]